MTSWHSYPSIFALGHRAIAQLLSVPVNVEEKIDGSQFSFGVMEDGEIKVRSKGAQLHPDAPEGMFIRAVQVVRDMKDALVPGWTYRGEYLQKPKHNALCYERVPARHIILFDINPSHEEYLPYPEKAAEAARLGLDVAPLLYTGMLSDIQEFRQFLEQTSILGGQKIEGVVVKPAAYNLFGEDKKVLMGKFVSEAFKEVHAHAWKESNPAQGDILQMLGAMYQSQARWQKAVLHLSERGLIEGTPRDIGTLMKEVPADIKKECADEIKDKLFAWAWPHIARATTRGLPEWYKDKLLRQQFDAPSEDAA